MHAALGGTSAQDSRPGLPTLCLGDWVLLRQQWQGENKYLLLFIIIMRVVNSYLPMYLQSKHVFIS